MDDLRSTFTEAVNAEDLFGLAVEQDLQTPDIHPDNLRTCQVFELRPTHFVGHFHRR
ncbi:hypothetical protein D3C86_2232190 [compost metagenome]